MRPSRRFRRLRRQRRAAPGSAAAPDIAHRLFPEITAQVHLGLAEGDMTPESISELNQALEAAGVDYTSEIYPGTIHGFTMSDTGAFSPSGLQRHWDRLLPLLDRTLASG